MSQFGGTDDRAEMVVRGGGGFAGRSAVGTGYAIPVSKPNDSRAAYRGRIQELARGSQALETGKGHSARVRRLAILPPGLEVDSVLVHSAADDDSRSLLLRSRGRPIHGRPLSG